MLRNKRSGKGGWEDIRGRGVCLPMQSFREGPASQAVAGYLLADGK